eukprot:m.240103 g.240103  ORF g.240103 m.240103 type:complete len:57 (-) comp15299_c0_seq11:4934-5104(-)
MTMNKAREHNNTTTTLQRPPSPIQAQVIVDGSGNGVVAVCDFVWQTRWRKRQTQTT